LCSCAASGHEGVGLSLGLESEPDGHGAVGLATDDGAGLVRHLDYVRRFDDGEAVAVDGERGKVAGVFVNRLRLGMPLQTDPTVIFGLGTSFDGNLRKRDLVADTPYNTYTRAGLPPTPIAVPSKAALIAAVHPEATRALYFVARGDGSSEFSETLADHNRAVNRYQRKTGTP